MPPEPTRPVSPPEPDSFTINLTPQQAWAGGYAAGRAEARRELREVLSGDSILGVAGQIRLFASECERQRPGQVTGWVFTWREWADAIDAALDPSR